MTSYAPALLLHTDGTIERPTATASCDREVHGPGGTKDDLRPCDRVDDVVDGTCGYHRHLDADSVR